MENFKATISVIVKEVNGEYNTFVQTPREQEPMPLEDAAHMLASGISVIIRNISENKDSKIKDHELLRQIVDHLQMEFVESSGHVETIDHE